MEWNPTSLSPAHHHHSPGSLTIPAPYHHIQQPPSSSSMSSSLNSLSSGGRGGGVGGSLQTTNDGEDRIGSLSRNSSPATLAPDFGDDSLGDENHDDLLVFGYGCKIFRDDERAEWIEEQKHLIPWMGHSELLIDRYDCRGALMDISRYEPGSGYDSSQDLNDESADLNSSYEQEQLLEQELDEERYKELNEDVDYDEGAYDRAGDYKRLQTAMNGMLSESQERGNNNDGRNYAAFQYNYDAQSHDICIGPEPKRVHDEDAPYVKPVGLYIPEEIILPSTMKVHAIIEKTAKFIASQGNQMEIILKTKQSSNPLFDFLNHGGNLNPYYKFLVHAIRSGIYRPPTEQDDVASAAGQNLSSEYSGSEEDSEHHTYLHPSLFRTSNVINTSTLSSIDYTSAVAASGTTSSRHNAYSMLVSKIKGTDSPDPISQQQPISTSSTTYPPEYPPSLHQNSGNQKVYSLYGGYQLSSQQTPASAVPKPQKKLPSTPDQLIIEKMASYVIKNGANFEVLAKNKSDPRFGFLNPSHEYHWYYLNCKERFKAESTAVVASSDFVNYSSSSNSSSVSSSLNNSPTKGNAAIASSNPTIKKSAVAAELAELKRKNSALVAKREASKEKNAGGGGGSGGVGGAENVFSQASLVQNKEKDKPVIRFSTSLSLNSISSGSSVGDQPSEKSETKASLALTELPGSSQETKTKEQRGVGQEANHKQVSASGTATTNAAAAGVNDEDEEEEGEIRDGDGDSDSDLYLLDDDPGGTGGGNSTPASEDDEIKVRRRLERKRKAALFLQKLKMAKTTVNSSALTKGVPSKESSLQIASNQKPVQKPMTTGTSLGDLLNRRLQTTAEAAAAAQQEKVNNAHNVPPEITLSDSEDNARPVGRVGGGDNDGHFNHSDSSKDSSTSRHSSRARSSRNHATSSSSRTSRKRRRRRRSRSYSSHSPSRSSSASSYESGSHSRKKSSKKKRKKKKKKYEKSSSRSSHKSKRR